MSEQLDTLHNLVYGTKAPELDTSDIVGQEQINRSEQWLAQNRNVPEGEKLENWMTYNKDWTFTPNNREYYWDTIAELTPGPNEQARKGIVKNITNRLNELPTQEEKASFYRDNAYSWSRDIHKSLGDYFFELPDMQQQKDIAKLRINQVAEIDRLFNDYIFDLDPHVSLDSHAEDALRAYDMGYGEHLSAKDGRITVPLDGVDTTAFSLPKPVMGLQQEVISKTDLFGRIKSKLKPQLERSREEARESERIADLALLNRVETGAIPDHFMSNVIIDGVVHDEQPFNRMVSTLHRVVDHKRENGEYVGNGSSARAFYSMYKDIQEKVTRRMESGSSS